MGSTGSMYAAGARSFTQYVAMVVALNARHLGRLRRVLRSTALAHRSRDRAAEERWEDEGGNSQSAVVRQRRPA